MATALPRRIDAGMKLPRIRLPRRWPNNESHTIEGDVTNTSSPLTFSGNGAYTLTVNGTLHSDIRVTSGATLSIVGAGTIQGSGYQFCHSDSWF